MWVRRREKGVQRTVFSSPLTAHDHEHWTWSLWSGDARWLLIHNNARSRFTTLECIYLNSKRLSRTTITAIDFGQLVPVPSTHLDFNFSKYQDCASEKKTHFRIKKKSFIEMRNDFICICVNNKNMRIEFLNGVVGHLCLFWLQLVQANKCSIRSF